MAMISLTTSLLRMPLQHAKRGILLHKCIYLYRYYINLHAVIYSQQYIVSRYMLNVICYNLSKHYICHEYMDLLCARNPAV